MTKPIIVDSHCHLNFPDFKGEVDEIIKHANENGVRYLQNICTKISEFPDILAIAEKYDNVFASVGIHPHEAAKEKISAEELVKLANHPKVIGIGEAGLDYHYEHSPREAQKEVFLEHIKAARESGLPLIIHTREADEDMVEILKSEMKKGKFKALIHCFSSSLYLSAKTLALGCYISIPGIITFRKSEELRNIVKDIPLSRLLVETDAPFLAPAPFRGKRNEPAYTRYTAELLAELKGISYDELAKVTTDNFFELFAKAKR